MQLERVPARPGDPLPPGRYFVYIDAPVAVLDGMAKMPNVGRSFVHLVFDLSGADVVYLGSGTTWTREDGALRRVFSVAFEIPDDPGVRVYYAAAVPLWVVNAAIIAGSVAFFGAFGGITGYALYRQITGIPTEDLPGVVEDVRDTTRAVANTTGWLVFGGLAVGGYLVAKNQGWLK